MGSVSREYLPQKPEELSLDPRNIKTRVSAHLKSQCWKNRDRQILSAHWSVTLAELWFTQRPCLKRLMESSC